MEHHQRQVNQLKSLTWKFVDLKARLECQLDSYIFRSPGANSPFDEDSMVNFTGKSDSDMVAELVLSPSLWKVSLDGTETLIHKARVMTTQAIRNPYVGTLTWASSDFIRWNSDGEDHDISGSLVRVLPTVEADLIDLDVIGTHQTVPSQILGNDSKDAPNLIGGDYCSENQYYEAIL